MDKKWIGIGIVVLVIVLIGGFFFTKYNELVSLSEKIDSKYSDIDTQLQRRADLIPNLVSSVKGIMSHEQEAIDKITDARTKLVNAKDVTEKANADNELTKALNNFVVIAEAYPDLKANTNYNTLMDELAGTENRIATSRKDYNEAVEKYNSFIKKIPTSLVAKMFGFNEKDYFKAADGANEVPQVNFN